MEKISIVYQTIYSDDFVQFTLTPDEYYDTLEPGETSFEKDGIPKYLDPLDYLPLDSSEVKLLVIKEPCETGINEFRIQQLDGKRSYCLHSLWTDGTEELIHSTNLTENTYHLIRTLKDKNGYWSVSMNTFVHDPPIDLIYQDYVGNYSFEQRAQFWQEFSRRFDL